MCSVNADMPQKPPNNPQPKKTKKGERWFPPKKERLWKIGERTGASLRSAYQTQENDSDNQIQGSGKRPHARKAHWHTYWTGEGRTIPILKWVSTALINIDAPQVLPQVTHSVSRKP